MTGRVWGYMMIEDLLFSCNVVLPIFFLILLGYVLTRIHLWNENFLKIANDLCFKCLLPVLLFYNVAVANIFEVFNGKLILYVCICACVICGLLFLVMPLIVKDNKRRGVMIQGTFRSNFLLFGVPLGLSIGGVEGSVLAAVVASFYIIRGEFGEVGRQAYPNRQFCQNNLSLIFAMVFLKVIG